MSRARLHTGNHRIRLGEDLLVGVEICGTTADELLYLSRRVGPARRRKVRVALNDEIPPEPAAGPKQPVVAVSLRVRPAKLEELAANAKLKGGWILGGYLSNWVTDAFKLPRGVKIVQDILPNKLTDSADVLLPAAAWATVRPCSTGGSSPGNGRLREQAGTGRSAASPFRGRALAVRTRPEGHR